MPFLYAADGSVTGYEATSKEDAKQIADEFRFLKRELDLRLKETNLTLSQVRMAQRQQRAQTRPMMRGGGNVGRFVRDIQHAQRYGQRVGFSSDRLPIEQQKFALQEAMIEVERDILALDKYIHSNGEMSARRVFPAPPAPPETFWQRTGVIVAALILFYPLGAVLTWLKPGWSKNTRLAIIIGVLVLGIIAMLTKSDDPKSTAPAPSSSAAKP